MLGAKEHEKPLSVFGIVTRRCLVLENTLDIDMLGPLILWYPRSPRSHLTCSQEKTTKLSSPNMTHRQATQE